MSVSRECLFIENQPGKWYLLIALQEYGELTDAAEAVGPFQSEEEVDEYLRDYYSNPGAVTVETYQAGQQQPEHIRSLISRATRPTRSLW